MSTSESGSKRVDLYGASYRNFAHDLYGEIRREAFGDCGIDGAREQAPAEKHQGETER